MSKNNQRDDDADGGVLLQKKEKTKKPSLYRVLMLNDDYTPMEFVVLVLQRFFGHNYETAQQIMLHVHQRGVGICGVYTYEVAEAKASQVMNFARQNEHPRSCSWKRSNTAMLSPELEETLRRALSIAGERSHEFATLEHLLLALIDDEDALQVLQGCKVDIAQLRDTLVSHIEDELSSIVNPSENLEVQPTAGFQRVVQRAIIHTQSSGRGAATGANILIAMYSERESYAVWFLSSLNMTRLDAVSFVSHGSGEPVHGAEQTDESAGEGEAAKSDPLSEYAVDLMAKARDGRIDPLIGRDKEVDRTVQVLCRRTKNNPLYVGDPGWQDSDCRRAGLAGGSGRCA